MDVLRADADSAQQVQCATESVELPLGESRIERVLNVGKVGVRPFDLDAGKRRGGLSEFGNVRESDTLPVRARFDLQVNPCRRVLLPSFRG